MIEPLSLSVLAGAITTYIVPKALEKVGEKVGQEKMQATRTDGILAMAEV